MILDDLVDKPVEILRVDVEVSDFDIFDFQHSLSQLILLQLVRPLLHLF